MTTVEREINESNTKIVRVKRIIKKRVEKLISREVQQTPISSNANWKEKKFLHPERNIRIGTLFSGIGAIEHAFQRLGLKHEIIFAGDIEPNCKKSYLANYNLDEKNGLVMFVILTLNPMQVK